jgi:peptidoglycan/LPS O-acetylase OafA/YrhL
MFGTLRLCLAVVVMYSHLGVMVAGFNPGVSAVVIFILLAGRVSAHLLRAFGDRTIVYYAERALRICPAYFCILLLAAGIWKATAVVSPFLPAPDAFDWASNLLIVPLDFRLGLAGDGSGGLLRRVVFDPHDFTLIPPAWSLGLELQFYALTPLLMALSAGKRARFMAASFCVWVLAGTGVLDTDTWGYRLAAGTLFVFMAGMEMHAGRYSALASIWLAACLMCGAIYLGYVAARPYNFETSLGLMIGIPLVLGCSRLTHRRFDSFMGGLSYPLFLLHFPLMWLFESAGYKPDSVIRHLVFLGVTLCASALAYRYIDQPLSPLRNAFRRLGATWSAHEERLQV